VLISVLWKINIKPFLLDRCPSAFISAVDPPPPQSASLSYHRRAQASPSASER
jgi:hypothetical protein